jgi:GPH family glycoside/pentoside/hexuronide:cation symporter
VCYVVASIPGAIPGLLMPYFNQYVIQPENPDRLLMLFLFTYFASGFLFLPAWLWAARRFGKTPTWLASFFMGITGGVAMFFLGKGDVLGLFVLIAWAGASFGAGLFLAPAIQADVIDYDELHSGKRREAQYMAFWGLVPKFIVIPSASIPLAILAWLGYVPNVEQTPRVTLAIRAIFALTPAFFSTLAFFIAWRFPITEKIHREILVGIDKHARGEPALDPLTGQVIPPPGAKRVDEETGWFLDHFSRGELERVLRRGPRSVLRDVLLAAMVALAIAVALAGWAARDLFATVDGTPGPLAVLAIVAAGFSFTAFIFHVFRIRPALRLRARAVSRDTLRAHLGEQQPIGVAEAPPALAG